MPYLKTMPFFALALLSGCGGGGGDTCESLNAEYRKIIASSLRTAADSVAEGTPDAADGAMGEHSDRLEKIRTTMEEKNCSFPE